MNFTQLVLFTENLAEMLNSGVAVERAITVASRCMRHRENRKFADDFRTAIMGGHDPQIRLSRYNVPPVYPAIINCGLLTGRLAEALESAAYFLNRLMPLRRSLRRCTAFAVAAYLLGVLTSLYFYKLVPFCTLFVLAVLFLLPRLFVKAKYFRDLILAKLPYSSTWLKQLSLLEFVLCLEIVYDSSLDVRQMFKESIQAIGNLYLRAQAQPALTAVGSGHSFTHSLAQIPFFPPSLIDELHVGEVSGTLDKKLHWLASQMRQLIDAKLEPIRALAIAIVINVGLIPILAVILPRLFPQYPLIPMALLGFGGYATLACARYAFSQYMDKSSSVNITWNQTQ